MRLETFFEKFELFADAPDAVTRMRDIILRLAVQGKLSNPLPGDAPVAKLREELAEARAKRISPGQRRFQGATADDNLLTGRPISTPKHWAWVPLNQLGYLSGGMTPSKAKATYWDGEVNWFSPKDIKADQLFESELKITAEGVEATGLQVYPPGCLFMVARSGILKRTFPVAINGIEATVNQDLKVLTPFISGLERYLQIMFRGMSDFIISSLVKTGMTVQSLKYEEFEVQAFPLPPFAEQKRIVAKVDELMALCDRLEAQQEEQGTRYGALTSAALTRFAGAPSPANLNLLFHRAYDIAPAKLRRSILALAVEGKLVPQDPQDEPAQELFARIQGIKEQLIKERALKRVSVEENPNAEVCDSLPQGWLWARLGNVFDVRDGTHDTPKYTSEGFPLITSKNIYSGTLSFDGANLISEKDHRQICERSRVDRGDILFAMIGSIGNPVIVNTDREFSIKNVALFKYYSAADAEPLFLLLYLNLVAEEMRAKAAGGVQSFVSLGFLRNYPFPLPPLAEQRRIVAKVNELMVLVDQLEAQLTTARTTAAKLLNAVLAELTART